MDLYYYSKKSGKVYKYLEERRSWPVLRRLTDSKVVIIPPHGLSRDFERLQGAELEKLYSLENETNAAYIELLQEKKSEGFTSRVGIIVDCSNSNKLDDISLESETLEQIKLGIHKARNRKMLLDAWNLKSIPGANFGQGMNLYGPPGTGKTMAAQAIARELGKNVLQVDYSQIVSKWVGETGKNIKALFDDAKKGNAIIFFDEADSLLSRRMSLTDSNSNNTNQSRNILMQEMDRFDGVCLFATNFFGNYDEAINRRIGQHIEFKLPTEKALEAIFKLHIPKEVPQKWINYKVLAKEALGLSGGDVRTVCINAIVAASMKEEKILLVNDLSEEIKRVKNSKDDHKGVGNAKKIGL